MESKICIFCNSSIPQQGSAWVKHCLCSDSNAEVHRHCLLARVQRIEERYAIDGGAIICLMCGAHLNISPDKGPLVWVLEAIDRRWYQRFCEVAMKLCTVMFVDLSTTTVGLMILGNVYGHTATKEMLMDMNPLLGVNLCQAIFYTCVFINSLRWEEALLHALRRCSNIPIVGRILPLEDNNVIVPAARRTSVFDHIPGAYLLPVFAGFTGNLLFFAEPSRGKRFILGGAVFILIKGFLKAYCQQKNYVRQSCLTLANYSEHA